MSEVAIKYYERKYGNDTAKAFIHLVKEVGEVAGALEKGNADHAKIELTEIAALLQFMAKKHGMDLQRNIEEMYTKKLAGMEAAAAAKK